MHRRLLSCSLAAAVLAWVVSVSAQTSGQTPKTGTASAQPSGAQAITVTGCVQKETDVLRGSPVTANVGMGDEFVLTRSMVKSEAGATSAERPSTTGTAGRPGAESAVMSGTGKVYRVTGDKEGELKKYVGQQVEIVGNFKHEADARQDAQRTAPAPPPQTGEQRPASDSVPEITIQTIRPLSVPCSGADIKK